jgi:hypothetical protein
MLRLCNGRRKARVRHGKGAGKQVSISFAIDPPRGEGYDDQGQSGPVDRFDTFAIGPASHVQVECRDGRENSDCGGEVDQVLCQGGLQERVKPGLVTAPAI